MPHIEKKKNFFWLVTTSLNINCTPVSLYLFHTYLFENHQIREKMRLHNKSKCILFLKRVFWLIWTHMLCFFTFASLGDMAKSRFQIIEMFALCYVFAPRLKNALWATWIEFHLFYKKKLVGYFWLKFCRKIYHHVWER